MIMTMKKRDQSRCTREAFLRTAMDSPEAPVPNQQGGYRHLHREAIHRHPMPPAGNYAPAGAAPQNQNGYARGGQGENGITGERTAERLQTAPERLCSRIPAHRITHGAIRTSSLPAAMLLETGSSGNTGRLSGRWIYPGCRTAGREHFVA